MSSQIPFEYPTDYDEVEAPSLSRVRATRRHYLLESALKTFLRDGYRAATMDRVAEDAGVIKQTLYNYFEDKEDLIITLLEERKVERILAVLAPGLEAIANGDVEHGLRAATEALLCSHSESEHTALFQLVIELTSERPELTALLRERIRDRVFQPTIHCVRDAFGRAVAAGHLRDIDVDVAARAFFGTINWSLLVKPLIDDEYTLHLAPERLAAGLADILSHGLLRTED